MKTTNSNLKKVLVGTLICVSIIIGITPIAFAAHEVVPAGFLCGANNSPPAAVHLNGSHRIITRSVTTAGLSPNAKGFRQVRHSSVVKSILPNGNTGFTRPLSVTSLAVAQSFPEPNPGLFYPRFLPIDRSNSPVFLFAGECGGSGVVPSGGNDYVWVSGGVASSEDTSAAAQQTENSSLESSAIPPSKIEAAIQGRDLTVMNVWILNPANGNIVRTFRLRPKPGRILLPLTSGLFDIDSDGNVELVLVYVRFIGDIRYDFVYEYYNIVNGQLENTRTVTQFHKLTLLK